ncbi:MAG: glycogen-binding domain-containing protein [Verrucomicrobiae bacterium]|nr:glycogen-binding domain-containing protein [Verrucomicrobiae bacterium]
MSAKTKSKKNANITSLFRLFSPEAREVKLAGDFNHWAPQAMKPSRKVKGAWELSLKLSPGQYQYKFLVDGDWQVDPSHGNTTPNSFGTANSIIRIGS